MPNTWPLYPRADPSQITDQRLRLFVSARFAIAVDGERLICGQKHLVCTHSFIPSLAVRCVNQPPVHVHHD